MEVTIVYVFKTDEQGFFRDPEDLHGIITVEGQYDMQELIDGGHLDELFSEGEHFFFDVHIVRATNDLGVSAKDFLRKVRDRLSEMLKEGELQYIRGYELFGGINHKDK